MPDKQDIIDSIQDSKTYNAKEVKTLVDSVKTTNSYPNGIAYLKAGDVFIAKGGFKRRPYVVISVRETKGLVISVPLTTTKDELALTPYTSRFLGSGWFTNQLVTVKIEFVKQNFAGVLENRAIIRQFKRDLKQFYKGLL